MSELKARGVDDVYVEYYNTGKHELAQVYLKSEADKVIAELQKQVHDYAQGLYVMQARAEKEARHQKYKRCLAMAKWCRTSARCDENLGAFKYRDWYWTWFKRWLELAEKFKEAK